MTDKPEVGRIEFAPCSPTCACDKHSCKSCHPPYDTIEYTTIDAMRQENARLREALKTLVYDLEDRARWMRFEPQKLTNGGWVIPCGFSAYCLAKRALGETE